MEFKGTKEKWFIEYTKSYINEHGVNVYVISTDDIIFLCEVYKDEYNAKLISKAPEMLEMLNRISEINFNDEIQKEIKQLIKEATEL